MRFPFCRYLRLRDVPGALFAAFVLLLGALLGALLSRLGDWIDPEPPVRRRDWIGEAAFHLRMLRARVRYAWRARTLQPPNRPAGGRSALAETRTTRKGAIVAPAGSRRARRGAWRSGWRDFQRCATPNGSDSRSYPASYPGSPATFPAGRRS